MKALSIRQPWAWAILNADKDIENRDWRTNFRGRIAVHAAKTMTRDDYDATEPEGWIRCVDDGRRRPDGDETKEYINL